MNHVILVNLLRKEIKDERVIQMVKRYLRSGVMENGVVSDTEEGSPLLANIYLNEFDQEYLKRGVPCVRYADDIDLGFALGRNGGGIFIRFSWEYRNITPIWQQTAGKDTGERSTRQP